VGSGGGGFSTAGPPQLVFFQFFLYQFLHLNWSGNPRRLWVCVPLSVDHSEYAQETGNVASTHTVVRIFWSGLPGCCETALKADPRTDPATEGRGAAWRVLATFSPHPSHAAARNVHAQACVARSGHALATLADPGPPRATTI